MKKIIVQGNRLVYRKEFEEIEAKYESMGLEIPQDELSDKFDKFPIAINADAIDMVYVDNEEPGCCIILIEDMVHLVDIDFHVIMDAYKQLGFISENGLQ